MIRRPPKSRRNDPLSPYSTLVRSVHALTGQDERAAPRPVLRAVGAGRRKIERTALDAAGQEILRASRVLCGTLRNCREQGHAVAVVPRSEEHTSELQSLMRTSYAVFCLKKKKKQNHKTKETTTQA